MQWIKLKKDYIPHHGDTVSMCIVAAGFDKDRARQLLGPPARARNFADAVQSPPAPS